MYLRYLLLLFALSTDSCLGCLKNHKADVVVEEPREPIDVTLKLDCPFHSETLPSLTDIENYIPTVRLMESEYKTYIKGGDPNKCCDVTCSFTFNSPNMRIEECNSGRCPKCIDESNSKFVHVNADSCSMTFLKKEVLCAMPKQLHNGFHSCPDGHRTGSTCHYTCFDRFILKGGRSVTCNDDGNWEGKHPTCTAKRCDKYPNPAEGEFKYPDGTVIGSLRFLQCAREGYTPYPRGPSRCSISERWLPSHAVCEDTKPPQINNCPNEKIIKASSGENETEVEWPTITVSDNSNKPIKPTSTVKASPGGGTFELGYTLVQFTAKDSSQNQAQPCVFLVIVKSVICRNPYFKVKYLHSRCDEGMSVGKSCVLTCELSLELIGEQYITCTLKGNTTEGYWAWNNGTDVDTYNPSCRVHNCTSLPAPNNGGMVCDTWVKGALCQVQCEEGYDIPYTATFVRLYTCGMDVGVWTPDTVPDCSSPCPAGSCHNSTRDECMACGYGQYQSQEGQTSCSKCPDGNTTVTLANVDVSSCEEMCGPGTYSNNGVVPCFKCPLKYFQHEGNKKECIPCPVGTTTEEEGAISTKQCVAFDFLLRGPITVPLEGMKPSRICDFTFSVWIKLVNTDYGGIKFQVYSPTIGTALDIYVSSDIRVILRERDELHAENGVENKWLHVAVTWSHPTLTVYVGGTAIAEEVFQEAQDCPSSTPSVMEITIRGHAYMYLRDLNFLPSANSEVVRNMSTTCSSYSQDSLFSLVQKDMAALDKVLEVVPSSCMKPDVCISKPCGDNVCIPTGSTFRCVCRGGYSGDKCDVPPDLCKDNICSNNSTCLVTSYGYRCECHPGYRGNLCRDKIADGGWGGWMDWGPCSVSCGNGTRTRHRYCDSPFPDIGGKPCDGNALETTPCQRQMCPECLAQDLIVGKGIIKTCEKEDGSITCNVECEIGLVFPEKPFVYTCKKGTWRPTKRTVSCTEPVTPIAVGINYTVVFGNSVDSHVISTALSKVGRNFSCAQDQTCSTTVGTSICSDYVRLCRKYGGIYYGSLTVQRTIQQDTIDVYKLQKNKQVMAYLSPLFATWNVFAHFSDVATTVDHRELEMSVSNDTLMVYPYQRPSMAVEVPGQFGTIMKTWKLLDDTNWEVRDNGYSDFQITLANQSQPQEPKILAAFQTMTCPRGAVQGGVFCIKCPPGKRYHNHHCKRCRHGFYQDVPGMSSCVPCPGFQTTELLGSADIAQCKDTDVLDLTLVLGMRGTKIGILRLHKMQFDRVSLNSTAGFVDFLAYDPTDEFIYFTTQEPTTIGRTTMGGLNEETLIKSPQDTIITGLDIDIASGLLFYTTFHGVLAALHISSGAEHILLSNLTKPRGLVLDQKFGAYWVESDTINYLHYSSKVAKAVLVDTNAVWNPTLHKHGNKITWNAYTRIREAYINGSNIQTIASNFTSRFGYTEEYFFYLDKNSVLMRVNRDQRARASVFSLPESVVRMRVVNTTKTTSSESVCSRYESDCDHGCFPLNATTRICFCALDYTLQSNYRTCRRDFSGKLETKPKSWLKPLSSDYSVPPSMALKIKVKACHSARVALAETGKRLYLFELDRSRGNETEMAIKKLWPGAPPVVLVHKTFSRLDCDTFRLFWITWNEKVLRIGRGKTLYSRQILVAKDSRPFTVNFVLFGSGFNATALWQF